MVGDRLVPHGESLEVDTCLMVLVVVGSVGLVLVLVVGT